MGTGSFQTSFRFQALATLSFVLGFSGLPSPAYAIRAGALESRLNEIYRVGREGLSPCEQTDEERNQRLTLAQALDDRAEDFRGFYDNRSSPSFSDSEIKVGPLRLVPRPASSNDTVNSQKTVSATDNGWVSNRLGWKDLYKDYLAIRNTRVNESWAKLLGKVKATLADDERRAFDGASMSLSAKGIEEAPKLFALIQECLSSAENSGALSAEKCAGLAKPESFSNAISINAYTKEDFTAYTQATRDPTRIRLLKSLANEIEPYLTYFEPVRQKGVRISDAETLILSLDSGNLRGYETELGLLIEKFWKVDGHELKIEWMSSTRIDPLFRLFFDLGSNAQSYVNARSREIHIAQNTYETTPAYEIGRALGFRPRSFAVWRPELCQYEDQFKPSDFMSDSRFGSITKEHWDSLLKTYAE